MKLNVGAFAITTSVLGGGGLFGATVWMMILNGITREKTLIGMMLPGYKLSPFGAILGGIYGTMGGLVGGAVFSFAYNTVAKILGDDE
jgi:hypothetical protein